MKLGGWLRLWIVLTLLWGIVVSIVAYNQRPTIEQLQYNWVRDVADAVAEKLSLQSDQKVAGFEIRERWVKDRTDADVLKDLERLVESPTDKQRPYAPDVALLNAKHRALIAGLPADMRTHIVESIAWWLGPTAVLLALGWAVGWVIRGFREPRALYLPKDGS